LERIGLGEADPQPVQPGASLFAHDLLRTSAGVIGEVALADGSRVKLNENTSLRLRPESLVLYAGVLWIQAEPSKTRFQVRTPMGVGVEVVGTTFLVAFSKATTKTTVTVREGTVRVRRGSEVVRVESWEQCVVGPEGSPSPPRAVDAATWASLAAGEPPPPPIWAAYFQVVAEAPENVFSTPDQPCLFTLRLHNNSDEEHPVELRYQLTDLVGAVVKEDHASADVPASRTWELPFSVAVPQSGLYTLRVMVESGATTWERNLDFAVEEGGEQED